MTKSNTCLFATVLYLIRETVYGRQKKKKKKKGGGGGMEMDWQLVASYLTVKSTDIFCSAGIVDRVRTTYHGLPGVLTTRARSKNRHC